MILLALAPLLATCFLLLRYVLSRAVGPLPVFFVLGAILQFAYAAGYILLVPDFLSTFVENKSYLYIAMGLVVVFVSLCWFASNIGSYVAPFSRSRRGDEILKSLLLGFSILALWSIVQPSLYQNFSDRLVTRSGAGYIFIFGYAGLAYCFSLALLTREGKFGWLKSLALSAPTVLFFALAGHRAAAVTALAAGCWGGFALTGKLSPTKLALIFVTAVALANPINYLTGGVRSLFMGAEGVSVQRILERSAQIAESQSIPLANSHIEMIAGYLERSSTEDLILGTYQTTITSALNFLPRALFPEKGNTSGVYFASIYFPEWFVNGVHSSSLTTGIFLDAIFNFGLILGPIFLIVFYYCSGRATRKLWQRGGLHSAFALYLSWVLGFNAFFDDLGGTVNKAFIGIVVLILLKAVNLVVIERAIGVSRDFSSHPPAK